MGVFSKNFIAGAMAGAVASIVTCPFDVLKTRAQMQLDVQTLNATPF